MASKMLGFLAFAVLASALFAAQGAVVVNSLYWEDILSGSIYAAQNGYSYFFVLTPSHGEYLANFLSKTDKGVVLYYESNYPVLEGFGAKLSGLGSRLTSTRQDGLASLFASKAPKDLAVVVGKEYGAEALSIAPYAALMNGAMIFADAQNADSAAANAKSAYKKAILYGSISAYVKKATSEGMLVVNTGSTYSDNLAAMQLFYTNSGAAAKQVSIVSGRTFERSMVSADYPIMLVGQTEALPSSVSMLASSGVRNGLVYQGDADIETAVQSIRAKTGMPVFAKLGEGFTGDAQMKELAVMPIGGTKAYVGLSGPTYDYASKAFRLGISNSGNVPMHVRATLTMPYGASASSTTTTVAAGKSGEVLLPLDASGSIGADGKIPSASIALEYGTDKALLDNAETVKYVSIAVSGKSAPATETATPASKPIPATAAPDKSSGVSAILIVLGVVAICAFAGRESAGKSRKPRMKGKGKK